MTEAAASVFWSFSGRAVLSPPGGAGTCGALHSCLLSTYIMDTRRQQTFPAAHDGAGVFFPLFAELFHPLDARGTTATDKLSYEMRSLWTLVGRTLSRLLQRFETVASPEQPVVKNGLASKRSALEKNLGKGS